MLFKTIARETIEVRGKFSAVPAGMNLKRGIDLLRSQNVAGVAHGMPWATSAVLATHR